MLGLCPERGWVSCPVRECLLPDTAGLPGFGRGRHGLAHTPHTGASHPIFQQVLRCSLTTFSNLGLNPEVFHEVLLGRGREQSSSHAYCTAAASHGLIPATRQPTRQWPVSLTELGPAAWPRWGPVALEVTPTQDSLFLDTGWLPVLSSECLP